MSTESDLPTGTELYRRIPTDAAAQRTRVSDYLEPVLEVIDQYGELVSRAVRALGLTPPASRQDEIVRDLLADVFDFLYEWPRPLLEGRTNVAWPLGRRAFESLSLACACYQDASIAAKWDAGKEIKNAEIRKALSQAPIPESEKEMKAFYRYFSQGSHPNRDLIGERFLGAGNQFVLGAAGEPEVLIILDQATYLLGLWFWLGAFSAHVAREALARTDPEFGTAYMKASREAQLAAVWVTDQFNHELPKRQAELRAQGYT